MTNAHVCLIPPTLPSLPRGFPLFSKLSLKGHYCNGGWEGGGGGGGGLK